MANSDYSIKGSMGAFTTVTELAAGVGHLQLLLPVRNWKRVAGDVRRFGEGVMIGKEICMITATDDISITVLRGCADTIPQPHAEGTLVWFYEDAIGTELAPSERAAGTDIGVKILPTSVGGGQLALTSSPPNGLTFNYRFARPYPPGMFKVNGMEWFQSGALIAESITTAVLTWAHRDRVQQANTLGIWHSAGDVGPEPGTTYTVRIYRGTGGTENDKVLLNTYAGITGTTWTYTYAMALADFGANGSFVGYFELMSVRDGLESWQKYLSPFSVFTSATASGWGNNFGNNFGG